MPESHALRQFVRQARADGLSLEDINFSRLKTWEFAFAQWYVNQPRLYPLVKDQLAKALKKLKERAEFKQYLHLLQEDVARAAKEVFQAASPKMAAMHVTAAERLMDAGDVKSIHQYTTPVLDRVWPKKEEQTVAPTINVVLTAKQMELDDEEIPEVEYEVIENDSDPNDS
jgi:hypothetical protein